MAFKFKIVDIQSMRHVNISIIIFVSIILAVCGCRKIESINEPVEQVLIDTMSLEKYESFTFSVNRINLNVDKRARLSGRLADGTAGFSFGGIWIGAVQKGEARVNLVDAQNYHMNSNYTMRWGEEYVGIYSIGQAETENFCENWPVDYGAPYYINTPKLYGEEMCWASFRPDTAASVPVYSKSIKGLRINFACYGYSDVDLSKVIFIKYEFTNIGYENINGMYAGFYMNPFIVSGTNDINLAGYDSLGAFSYVYNHSGENETSMNRAIGLTFLETPTNVNDQPVISSSRRMERSYMGEYGNRFISSEEVLNALKGLRNRGSYMTNPVTGEYTKFAFTGNPITGEGWLDIGRDLRILISTGPFSIPVGESRNLIVTIVFEESGNLETTLNQLKEKIAQLRKTPSFWKY